MLRNILKNSSGKSRGRVGPVGLSLLAAMVTAVAFAAVSMAAKDDSGAKQNDSAGNGDVVRPAPGGPPPIMNLSDEDKQKLEDFRQCMSDQGVEPPPAPPKAGEHGTFRRHLRPPSEAERSKMDAAFEACKDKLPEGAQTMGPGGPCGPPPPGARGDGAGAPPAPPESGSQEDQSYSAPVPQGSTS